MDETQVNEVVRAASHDLAVGPPPIREIVADGVARRRRGRVAGAAAVAASVAIVGAMVAGLVNLPGDREPVPAAGGGTNGSPTSGVNAEEGVLTRTDVEDYMADLPGVALVLPKSLPTGYRWDGPSGYESGNDGQLVTRTSTFYSIDNPRQNASVDVCAHTSQGHTCPQGAARLTRNIGGVEVVISFSREPSADQRQFWQDVTLTEDTQVSWLS